MKKIIELYKNNIKSIIKNFTGQYNEDIEQEVYIKTWKGLNKYNENGKFKSWVSTITANTCRDYIKSIGNKQSKTTHLDDKTILKIKDKKPEPDESLNLKERKELIINAVNNLKPKYKEVIIMYEMKNLTYEEIAKIIKKPIGTVKSRLYHARKELSIALSDLI